ncbi:sensor histidine kinase [Vagococcus fessus]|uniref:histidine kinase n=1 Tax=Vagococcus fessus TaxID=120370 RepID=A0A430A7G5_9ENTE|nr:HAMP domain-containing sensor histidine kinase [Vagococcus fessus]RSU03017.1 hypothetical protein CBF31_04630 [Vagococcus fessus]
MKKIRKVVEFSLVLSGIVLLFLLVVYVINRLPFQLEWWGASMLSILIWIGLIMGIGFLFSGPERFFFNSLNKSLFEMGRGNFNIDLSSEKKKMARYGEWVEFLNKIEETSDNLAEMEKLKQSFISNVSHEIRSPLTSISGFAQLAQREKNPEKRAYYLETIRSECMRLSNLSESLLRLTELEGTAILSKSEFDLAELLEKVKLGFSVQLSEKNIELKLVTVPVIYNGDPILFYQIWQNLLGNAIKFSAPDSEIKLSLTGNADDWKIVLEDNGQGIPNEKLTYIFDRFYKVDDSRNSDIEGSGLGLSIVKEIVTLHDNLKIDVTSEENKGTTFILSYPSF